ncbi:CpaB family protein [Alkaliphilus crotonatoxidans]
MNREKQRKLLIAIIGLFFFSGILLYYHQFKIPRVAMAVEASVREELDEDFMPKELVWVVAKPDGIGKYTEITRELFDEHIVQIEMPTKYIVEGAIKETEAIEGMITKYNLSHGQQLIHDQFLTNEDWYGDDERLKEFTVTSLVANEVKSGNIVDVLVHYGNGDYDVVASKMKVRKIIESVNDEFEQDEKDYTIILSVDEGQYRDLTLAQELGNLETRLYHDKEQTQSIKTFDYHKALQQQRMSILNQKENHGVTDQPKDLIVYDN